LILDITYNMFVAQLRGQWTIENTWTMCHLHWLQVWVFQSNNGTAQVTQCRTKWKCRKPRATKNNDNNQNYSQQL